MQKLLFSPQWKTWLKIGRLVPIATASTAFVIGIISSLGGLPLSLADGMIISLLALLAIDALVERLNLLEQINNKVEQRLPSSECMKLQCHACTKGQHHSAARTEVALSSPAKAHALKMSTNGENSVGQISDGGQLLDAVVITMRKHHEVILLEIRQAPKIILTA